MNWSEGKTQTGNYVELALAETLLLAIGIESGLEMLIGNRNQVPEQDRNESNNLSQRRARCRQNGMHESELESQCWLEITFESGRGRALRRNRN